MITADTLREVPLFASVAEHDRATIAARAADVWLQPGQWLIHEGEVPAFFAFLEGRLAVIKTVGGTERVIATYHPGDFFGELSLLLGSTTIVGLRADEPSRVMRLEGADFHELIVKCPTLNREILAAMARRVGQLQQIAFEAPVATVTVVGYRWDLECHDLRDFLARNHVAFRWLDPDDPTTASSVVAPELLRPEKEPLVVFPDGSHLGAPLPYREVAERLGLQTAPRDGTYDVAIVGAGPAGLAAAVYGASEGLRTILIERVAPGGQAGTSSRIENYLGFPAGLSGDELSTRALQQAKRFGAEILVARTVSAIEPHPTSLGTHAVLLDAADPIEAKALVIATGVAWRKLAVPGADALLGRGIYYGAAQTEAFGTRGKDVFLIGGGNSAGQAAMFFTNYANSVTILVRGDALEASMSHYLIEQLATKTNVRVEVQSQVVAVHGADHLESIMVENRSGEQRTYATDALFVFIGADAQTAWLPREMVRDARGYICTGRDMADLSAATGRPWPLERDPYLLESSVPGIFAAGDVRYGSIKRVASGVGEGSMAIAFIHQYLEELSSDAIATASAADRAVRGDCAPSRDNRGACVGLTSDM